MKLGHIGTLILICGIGMSCLAIPIPDTIDNDGGEISEFSNDESWGWGGWGGGRALLKARRHVVVVKVVKAVKAAPVVVVKAVKAVKAAPVVVVKAVKAVKAAPVVVVKAVKAAPVVVVKTTATSAAAAIDEKVAALKAAADKVAAEKAAADKVDAAVKTTVDKVVVAPVVPVAPVAVPTTPIVVSPTASSSSKSSSGSHSLTNTPKPQHLIAAIHKFHKDTQSKMHDLKSKIEQLLKQNADKQHDELTHSEKNYKDSKADADSVSLKYDLYAKRLGALKSDIVLANGTFISHYNAMMSDNAYLLKLQLFKPSFIATLENLKITLAGLESGVKGLIGLKPDEKVELSRLMFKLRNSTYATTDDVAHDFLQFLEKHKSVLTADTSKTDAAKKKLDGLQQDYVDASKLSKAAYEEYLKFARIVAELKLQFAATASETELFDQLMHRVAAMLQSGSSLSSSSKCTASSFIHDDARKSCAVDLLKSHSHNNLV